MNARSPHMRAMLTVVAVSLAGSGVATPATAERERRQDLEFLGEAIVATGTLFEGTTVGGLSSIAYDSHSDVFYAISDDQQAPRFYEFRIGIGDGALTDGDVQFIDVTTLLAPDGLPYPPATIDPEGLALTGDGELLVTSEGIANAGIAPWVRRYRTDGHYLGDLVVPAAFAPTATSGVRQNLGFEAAGITPNGRRAFVGTEAALVQDGPPATVTGGTSSRILRYDVQRGRLDRQYVYVTEPIAEPPVPATAFAVNGLVELLPIGNQSLLAMERSFSVGAQGTGNSVQLYDVRLGGATNVNGVDSLAEVRTLRPVHKSLLLDLRTLGIPLDNLEGMALGPELSDGRQSLLLVSDNNFNATQFTQFLLFALD
jgi:3-phytase